MTQASFEDLRALLAARRLGCGEHPFLIWEPFEGRPQTWSYAGFVDQVERTAAGLRKRGVGIGDRVLVHLDNCPEGIIAWFACAILGAAAVTTNTKSTRAELAYFIEHCGAVGAITQPALAERVAQAGPALTWIVLTRTDGGVEAGACAPSAAETFEALDGDPSDLPSAPIPAMTAAGVQYTSGTTSRPKGVIWTHANALWGARVSAAHEDLRASDVHLVNLPLFHTNAQCYSVLASLWAGATVVLQPKFSASRFWPVSTRHGCTWTSMVPFSLKALMGQPLPERHDYRLWGNAICAPPTDAYFGVKTIGWWGMTETVTHGAVGLVKSDNPFMSMGRASPFYEIEILDEDGAPTAPGQVGDLRIRGRRGVGLFLEYLNDPAATAAAFDPHGFLITGDRAQRDEHGNLFFADRSKDMIKVGGENVAASEVERVIQMVAGVSEVAVVAQDHPMLDEVPVAFVLAASLDDPTLVDRIRAVCAEQLASFKQPAAIRLVDTLPRSTLEKVAKAELRAQLAREAL